MASNQSIEPEVTVWGGEQIKKLGWNYAFEQGSINKSISNALANSLSKMGGDGGCRVDSQLMLDNKAKKIPVLIEYKGSKDALEVLDSKHGLVRLKNDKNEFEFSKVISKYAVNGALYYSNIVLNKTEFKEVLAVGVNGIRDVSGDISYQVKAYIVNNDNPSLAIFLGEYSDLSFLDVNRAC